MNRINELKQQQRKELERAERENGFLAQLPEQLQNPYSIYAHRDEIHLHYKDTLENVAHYMELLTPRDLVYRSATFSELRPVEMLDPKYNGQGKTINIAPFLVNVSQYETSVIYFTYAAGENVQVQIELEQYKNAHISVEYGFDGYNKYVKSQQLHTHFTGWKQIVWGSGYHSEFPSHYTLYWDYGKAWGDEILKKGVF